MRDPALHRSACGCIQRESGTVEKCQRHLLADLRAAQALASDPPRGQDDYAT